MGPAEDEVLIRDDSGLLLENGETRVPRSQQWSKKLVRTVCLSLGFLVLGLCVAIPGPTLLDLEDQVSATTSEMMIVFSSRSMGYLLGALLGGVLFDCLNRQLLLFCTLLVSSVATIAIPWSFTLVLLATMFALQGTTMGILDTGGNVFCIQLWGKKNAPFIQTLHFAFGIGAFVAPLLAKPFLSSSVLNNTSIVQGNIPVAPFPYGHQGPQLNRTERGNFNDIVGQNHETILGVNDISRKEREFTDIGIKNTFLDYDYASLRIDNIQRARRQVGGEDGNTGGIWKWKKRQSKRETSTGGGTGHLGTPDTGHSLETSNNNTKTTPVVSNAGNDSNKSKVSSGIGENGTGSAVKDLSATNTVKGTDSNISGTENITAGNANVSALNADKVNTADKTNNTNSTSTTTLTTGPPTTEEKKVQKPSAATDNNRDPMSADGKFVAQHMDTHKVETEENQPGSQNIPPEESEKISDGTGVNGTSSNNTDTDNTGNETHVMDGEADNVNGTAPGNKDSSQRASPKAEPGKPAQTGSTMKPASPGVGSTIKATTLQLSMQGPSKLPTRATSTTTTASSSTTTTTTKGTTTTTATTTSTTSTTKTTSSSTATSSTPKPTRKTATLKTEKIPTSLSESPDFGHPVKQSTKTTEHVSTLAPGPENGSVNSPTVVNPSPKVNLTTTEVPVKPEIASGGFINKAINAVKQVSKIQIAYAVTGIALFLIAVMFLVLYCKDKKRYVTDNEFDELENFHTTVTCAKVVLIILLGVFFFLYMGLEVTFGALVTTFAVEHNGWSKEQGAVVAAIFWGSLATGRGLSIFIARCCGPNVMLVLDCIFMLIGGLVLSVGVQFYDRLLWVGTLILGLGMSSVFPAGISWAEKYFHLTGKSTAMFVIGSAIGQMFVPIITGYAYEQYGAMVLMYVTLALSVATLVIYILMQCVALKRGITLKIVERNGFLPLQEDEEEDNLEMDDLVHFDTSQPRKRHDKRGCGDVEYHTLISDLDDD